jgi:hypothetical protein
MREVQKSGRLDGYTVLSMFCNGEPIPYGPTGDLYYPSPSERLEAAKALTPYQRPRLAQIEQTVDSNSRVVVISAEPPSNEEWAELYGAEVVDVSTEV